MADTAKTIQVLLPIQIDGISALQVYMAYLEGCTAKDMDTRTSRYIKFVQWMSDTCEHLDYAILEKYGAFLIRSGNAESTVKIKLSNIRQFLLAAESRGIISNCVYYAKRGRRSKTQTFVPTVVAREESSQSQQEQPKRRGRKKKVVEATTTQPQNEVVVEQVASPTVSSEQPRSLRGRNGFKKTFLYDLFQINDGMFSIELLKKSFRKLATAFHPDHTNGSQEQFLACKEAYEYLMDTITRNSYSVYTQNTQTSSTVSDFVHSIYRRIGGYSAIRV